MAAVIDPIVKYVFGDGGLLSNLSHLAIVFSAIVALGVHFLNQRQSNRIGENNLWLAGDLLLKSRPEARKALKAALSLFISTRNVFFQAETMRMLGEYFILASKFEKAEYHLASARNMFNGNRPGFLGTLWAWLPPRSRWMFRYNIRGPNAWKFGEAQVLLRLATLENEKTKPIRTREYLDAALPMLKSLGKYGDDIRLAVAHYHKILSEYWRILENGEEAREECLASLGELRALEKKVENGASNLSGCDGGPNRLKIAIAYAIMLEGCIAAKNIPPGDCRKHEARGRFEKARELFRSLDNIHGEAWALIHFGDLMEDTEKSEVKAYYSRALSMFKHVGNKVGMAAANWKLGEQHARDKFMDLAQSHLRKAIDSAKSVNNAMEELCALEHLGDVEKDLVFPFFLDAFQMDGYAESLYADPSIVLQKRWPVVSNHREILSQLNKSWQNYMEAKHLADDIRDDDANLKLAWRLGEMHTLTAWTHTASDKSSPEVKEHYEKAKGWYRSLYAHYKDNSLDNKEIIAKIELRLCKINKLLGVCDYAGAAQDGDGKQPERQ